MNWMGNDVAEEWEEMFWGLDSFAIFSQNNERFEKQDWKDIQSILCLSYFIATVLLKFDAPSYITET